MREKVKKMTIDQLLDVMQWLADRAAYRKACNIYNPSAYADDETAWRYVAGELYRRGYNSNLVRRVGWFDVVRER